MLKRIFTGLLLVGVIIGFLFLREINTLYFDALIIIIMLLASLEMMHAFREHFDIWTVMFMLLFIGLIFPAYYYGEGLMEVFALYILIFIMVAVYVMFNSKLTIQTIKYFAFILIYPLSLIFTLFVINNNIEYGLYGLCLVFLIAPATDTFAYFTGRLIGGPKLCPKISPKKTIAGAIGGLIGGIVASIVVYYMISSLGGINPISSIFVTICIGIIGSVLTQIGDLVASYVKRSVGIKDYGKILPGHGGIMDRVDGFIFVAFLVFMVLTFFVG